MRRLLKLGLLALVAVATLSASSSSTATASEFHAMEFPAAASGEFGEGLTFATEGGNLVCNTAQLKGTLSEVSASLAMAPTLSNCSAFGFLEATVNPEDCKFVLNGVEETGEAKYAVTTDVSCPGGDSIKVTAGTCSLEIGNQTGRTGASVLSETATPPEKFTLEEKVTKIAYTVTKDGFLCALAGTGVKESGEFTGSVQVTASGEVLAENGITLADAHASPSPVEFTAATQGQLGGIFFTADGTFVIDQQILDEAGAAGYAIAVSSREKGTCPGDINAKKGNQTKCGFKIQGTNLAPNANEVLVTHWRPKGAAQAQFIYTPLRRIE